MAGRKSIEQRCIAFDPALHRYFCYPGVKFRETAFLPIDSTYAKHVQSFLSQGASLVETDDIDLPTYIYSVRRDTKDRALAKPIDGKCCANGQSSRKSWRNDNGDQVEGAESDGVPLYLRYCQRRVDKPVRKPTPMRTNCTADTAKPNPAMMASTPMNLMESRLRASAPGPLLRRD